MKVKINNLGNPFLLRIEEDGSGMISYNGGIYYINASSAEIIQSLSQNKSIDIICQEMSSIYGVPKNIINEDIFFLMDQLKKIGVYEDSTLL